jgi:hypothetical protein
MVLHSPNKLNIRVQNIQVTNKVQRIHSVNKVQPTHEENNNKNKKTTISHTDDTAHKNITRSSPVDKTIENIAQKWYIPRFG